MTKQTFLAFRRSKVQHFNDIEVYEETWAVNDEGDRVDLIDSTHMAYHRWQGTNPTTQLNSYRDSNGMFVTFQTLLDSYNSPYGIITDWTHDNPNDRYSLPVFTQYIEVWAIAPNDLKCPILYDATDGKYYAGSCVNKPVMMPIDKLNQAIQDVRLVWQTPTYFHFHLVDPDA